MINPVYSPAPDRYERGIRYRRCGRSGILLPEIALGLWHNFGDVNPLANSLEMAHYAFDHGIVRSSPPRRATTCGPAPTANGAPAST